MPFQTQSSMHLSAFASGLHLQPKPALQRSVTQFHQCQRVLHSAGPSRRPSAHLKHISTMHHPLSSVAEIDWLRKPVTIAGKVQRGFGRGSRDLGTPTANLPGKLVDGIQEVERNGVYLGYGRVPKYGGAVVKMVANLGKNITYGDVEERVVEAYLMTDAYDKEFYGEEMRLCIIGFLRPEWKFESLDELVLHIRNDVAVTDEALNLPKASSFRDHPSLIT